MGTQEARRLSVVFLVVVLCVVHGVPVGNGGLASGSFSQVPNDDPSPAVPEIRVAAFPTLDNENYEENKNVNNIINNEKNNKIDKEDTYTIDGSINSNFKNGIPNESKDGGQTAYSSPTSLPVSQPQVKDVNYDQTAINQGEEQLESTELGKHFVKTVLREFFNELRKHPSLVDDILAHESYKQLTRDRSLDAGPDVVAAAREPVVVNLVPEWPYMSEQMQQQQQQRQLQGQQQQPLQGGDKPRNLDQRMISHSMALGPIAGDKMGLQLKQQQQQQQQLETVPKGKPVGNGIGSPDQMASTSDMMAKADGIPQRGSPLVDPDGVSYYYYFYYDDDANDANDADDAVDNVGGQTKDELNENDIIDSINDAKSDDVVQKTQRKLEEKAPQVDNALDHAQARGNSQEEEDLKNLNL